MEKTANSRMFVVMSLVAGILFGIGLTLSDMINPQRVLGFLDVAGAWDPTLVFVMGGALLVTFPAFHFVKKFGKPVCALQFQIPTNKVIDRKLVVGAALFGVGWGLVGFCPGPALAALVTLQTDVFIFGASLVAGMLLFQLWDARSKP
ncbi:MAG: DUF6691 family protein [Pseudohongiellaceae bacterium]